MKDDAKFQVMFGLLLKQFDAIDGSLWQQLRTAAGRARKAAGEDLAARSVVDLCGPLPAVAS